MTPNNGVIVITKTGAFLSYNKKLKYVPRIGELICLDDDTIFYKVIKVVHTLSKPRRVWVYVSLFEE